MGYIYQIKTVCQTCGRRIGQFRNFYLEKQKSNFTDKEIFDTLGLIICCRTSFMSGTTKFHDTERREVVDGEYPPNDGPSYLSSDKSSISKIQKRNALLSSKSAVPLTWESKDIEVKKEKIFLKENINTKSKNKEKKGKNNLLSSFKPLPSVKKLKDAKIEENIDEDIEDDEESISYGDLLVEGEYNGDKIITDFQMPKIPGFPTVYKPERIGKDPKLRDVFVGYIEKNGEKIKMYTKVLDNLMYKAE